MNTSLCKESVQSEEVSFTSLNKVHVAAQRVKMKTIARVLFLPGYHPPLVPRLECVPVSQARRLYLHSAIKVSHVPDFPMP